MSDFLIAIILGCVEGLTEFLPVSSTGHMILVGDLLNFKGETAKTFEIVIQLGSILAVVVVYWKRLLSLIGIQTEGFKGPHLTLMHVIIAITPSFVLGFLAHDFIKKYLFGPQTVVIGLILGAILMIGAEWKKSRPTASSVDQITYKQALSLGLFQCLSLWPGFSRSGATISGGILAGMNHKTAAEFSFLIAVPTMIAATGYDLLKSYQLLSMNDLGIFAVGFVVAFIVAMLAIVSFIKIIEKVKLTPFAIYRFVLAGVFWYFFLR